jgi:hypothetical protein
LHTHEQVKRDCFAEFILGLAEGETRGRAMTLRAAGDVRPTGSIGEPGTARIDKEGATAQFKALSSH